MLSQGASVEELKQHAEQARLDGVAADHEIINAGTEVGWLFVDQKEDNWGIDGTQKSSTKDDNSRWAQGPKWSNNSCAIDVILVLALYLDAGRCIADQAPTPFLESCNHASILLLAIIRKP